MRKTNILSLLLLAVLIIVNCACEEDAVSTKHVYTQEELDYLDYLDSMNSLVQADTVILIEVELPMDTSNYRGVDVDLPVDAMMELFGYSSEEEIVAALGTLSDGFQEGNEITLYAQNRSTGYDYIDEYTAGAIGYWFDNQGDVTTWAGENSSLFLEYYEEEPSVFIGQFPGKVATGEVYEIAIILDKDDYTIGAFFYITIGEYYEE